MLPGCSLVVPAGVGMEVEELLGTAKVRRKTVAKEVWARAGVASTKARLAEAARRVMSVMMGSLPNRRVTIYGRAALL